MALNMKVTKNLGSLIVGAVFATGIGACATSAQKGSYATYTLEDENWRVSYYGGDSKKLPLGIFQWSDNECILTITNYKENYWAALEDVDCDGKVDAHILQEGLKEVFGIKRELRGNYEKYFSEDLDPMFEKFKRQLTEDK